MYARTTKKNLPWLVLGLGLAGLVLRRWLYAAAVDSRGLLTPWHPLEIALWCLTAGSLGYLGYTVWKMDGKPGYEENFTASWLACAGHLLAGGGVLAAVLLGQSQIGNLGILWRLLGLLSGPCLMAAGVCRGLGRKPFFLLHLIPCLFLVLHIINHYRGWSSDPQLQDYVFSLFACLSLMLFAFYNASFAVGLGNRRMQIGTGLAALYFCTVSLGTDADLWMNLGAIAWTLTGLGSLKSERR